MVKKSKNVEEDTNRTDPVATEVVNASRDDPEAVKTEAQEVAPDAGKDTSDSSELVAGSEIELVETVELEDPTPAPVPIDIADQDDPRMDIAARHDEKYRNFDKNGESELETNDPTDIIAGDDNEPEMVEVKIYGETRLVEKSKVDKAGGLQAYQKQQAVDAGMQDNARQRDTLDSRARALDARERQIAQQESSLPTPGANLDTPPADPPSQGDQSIDEMAKHTLEALYDGEDNAAELLTQLVKQAKGQEVTIDTQVLITQAADELERRTRSKKVTAATSALIDAHPALDRGHSQYDQRLWTAIDDETTVVERQNPEWEPQQVLDESYKRVSAWKGTHKTTSMTDKAADKRNMNRPRANSGRFIKPPPPPARTASDYVADLRKNRGQGA